MSIDNIKERLARLSPQQRAELLNRVAKQKNSLTAVKNRTNLPLSFAQQRLWFLDQLDPGSTNYNIPRAYRIRGPLDIIALRKAFDEIVRRHEGLHTTFAMQGDAPVQIITPTLSLEIPLLNADNEETLHTLIMAEANQPFDLQQGPLIRAKIIRLGQDDHTLLFNQHHIVSDGWSMGIFIRELSQLYTAFSNGENSPLAEPTLQYADFAVWQYRQSEELAKQLDFWKQKLAAPPILELPTDRPRPAVQSYRGAIYRYDLPQALADALKQLAQQEQVTLFMLLMAAFQTLLYRYSGQEEFTVGTPIAGRNRSELEGIIGFFVNTLVLRADLSDNPTFLQLLARTRGTSLEAFTHQEVPFEKLVEELLPERDMSRNPLFQVMLTLQNTPPSTFSLSGAKVEEINIPIETGKFDLSLSLTDDTNGLSCSFNYNTDLFNPSTIERMSGHLNNLLKEVIENPNQTISEFNLLSKKEKQTLLVTWNDTHQDFPTDQTVHALFEQQVICTPDAVALIFEEQQLSYRELNTRANQLAHYLIDQGLTKEQPIALLMDRCLELMIAILAILKAGGTYLPLDPKHPQQRIETILNDAGATLVLTTGEQEKILEHTKNITLLQVDILLRDIDATETGNPNVATNPKSIAYIIYTSGSTGIPKGVMIEHRSVVNLAYGLQEKIFNNQNNEPLRVALNTAITFDASVQQWTRLLWGDCIVILSEQTVTDTWAFIDALVTQRTDVLGCTPTQLRLLFAEGLFSTNTNSPSIILCGGEAIDEDLWQTAFAYTHSHFYNVYGPTECTVDTTCCLIDATPAAPTIGRPLPNVRAYILDAHLNPVPIGVPGELYLGGDAVGRGYLKRPELTAERYIKDPLSDEPDARFYKTGDLARYLPDGNIEYLGRIDFQVKLRGFRIELGEIESLLRQQPSVKDCVVTVREDTPGDQRLVAYIISKDNTVNNNELKNVLMARLPEYMVPSDIVRVDSFPLTSSGKTDRKALPAPDRQRSQAAELIAPRTPYEKTIAEIWCEILSIESIGINDNFFALGGHSLLGTRIIIHINKRFDTRLPLRNLFESPTIEGLAQAVVKEKSQTLPEHSTDIKHKNNIVHLKPEIPRQMLRTNTPLSFSQQRLWFIDQLYPGKSDYNLPELLRLDGPLNIPALDDSINAIITRHEILRTTFSKQNDDGRQCITNKLKLDLALIDLCGHEAPEDELQLRVNKDIAQPFNLASGPLIRAKLFRLADDSHVLLITMHHIISDGWSMEIFNRELGILYNAFCHNQSSPLADLPIQYLDYSVWQRQQTDILQQQLSYWKQQLDSVPKSLDLPTDKIRPTVQSFTGNRFSIEIPSALSENLKDLAKRENVTLFMLLLSAYQLLLHRYSGQNDILVGTPIAGRTQTELEGLIGFFVNSLVIRARITPDLSFNQLLAQVKETSLSAFDHQEIPFEKLVEALAPQRDMSRNPLFQVMFSLQNDTLTLPQMEQLNVRNLDLSISKAKFDLTLFIRQRNNGLLASFNYATDLFDPSTIERMAGHYLTLLTAIAEYPDKAITELPLLSKLEQAQMAGWNDTSIDYPRTESIQHLFEAQAEETPNAIAAICNQNQITYTDLNRRANQLASYLAKQGVSRGDFIGLCLERSHDTLVAMLAILKAGGAYVPLDPSYPKDRLALIIDDAGLEMIICHSSQLSSLPEHNIDLISIDTDWENIDNEDDANPPSASNGDSLAYIIYTSGSTGKPKGVCIPHKAVNRLVKNTNYVSLDQNDVIAQAANTAFDAATFEIWGALLNGGRIIIVPKEILLSQAEFTHLLRDQGVTTLFLTTALFNQMIQIDAAAFSSLKQLLFGGEACDPKWIRACLADSPPQRLLHVYGPTETTTFATWHEVHSVASDARTVPIGHPIANTTCYVLDTHRQPVPVGITGELYIGGDGVAREYLGRPELNAEKFIANPFKDGDRLYRTGDLVRYCADGAIEFVGRIDHQIKLRGFRIELGEIDEALKQHPALQDCLTLLREDAPGEKQLVAYVTTQAEQTVSEQELRQYLKEKLPEYMVPTTFVTLDILPLTPNGKVDRDALPVPSSNTAASIGPRNTLEFHLVKIWEDVLGYEPIGIQDNFFELGGHSLMAVKLMDQIEMHFGKKLPLDTLWFDAATIESMSRILNKEQENILWPELVPIKSGGSMHPLFVIHTMGGNLFHYYEIARALSPQLPVFGLQARGVYGKQAPRDNVADIAADCITAMRQQQPHGPYRIAGFSSGGIVAFEMAQQLHQEGEKVSRLILLDCYAPGVKVKGSFWKQVYYLFTFQKLRQFQERLYYNILHPLELRRMRKMNTIGETHRWAHWSYKPKPYTGRIDLFIATESQTIATDPLLGWSKIVMGDLLVHTAPGTHGLMVKAPHVEVLADKMQNILDQEK